MKFLKQKKIYRALKYKDRIIMPIYFCGLCFWMIHLSAKKVNKLKAQERGKKNYNMNCDMLTRIITFDAANFR